MLVICIAMATGYSVYTEKLTITGTIVAELQEQEIEIQKPSTEDNPYDDSGIDRFTVNSDLTSNILGTQLLNVVDEQAVGNQITTTLQSAMSADSFLAFLYSKDITMTLAIGNSSKYTFTNGKVEEIEASTEAGFDSRSQTISSTTIEPGGTAEVNIMGTFKPSNLQSSLTFKYKISFDTDDGVRAFYYTLIILTA